MSKRYFWLKLKDDFFDDDTIRYIEEQENGVIYSNFYLKLCLKSLKTGGKLIRLIGNRLIPYDVAALARLTNIPADTVAVAMQLFQKIGLVELLEQGEILLPQINEMIGSETDKAETMRRKRAEDRLKGNIVTPLLPERYPEYRDRDKEKDIEIDTEIEKDTETEKEKEGEGETRQADEDGEDLPKKEQTFKANPASRPDGRPTPQSVPYQQVQKLYNSICLHLPRCQTLSDSRRRAVRARFQSGKRLEDFQLLFEKAEASRFLRGDNPRGWQADFDWLIGDTHMVRVLEGIYDDIKGVNQHGCGNGTQTGSGKIAGGIAEIPGGIRL